MTTPELDRMRIGVDGRVGYITLDRPAVRNALNHQDLTDLIAAADWMNDQPDVGVVVLSGAGPSFCGGFNLEDPGPLPGDGTLETALDFGRRSMNAVASMRAITVARVQGRARGGGLVLALSCDLQVAADDALLSLPEAHLGMPVPWATLPRLVRAVGPMRTKELVLSGRPLSGAAAQREGLITTAVPLRELEGEVDRLVAELLRSPNRVLREVKAAVELLAEGIAPTHDGADDVRRLREAFADPDCTEARRAYLSEHAITD